MSDADLQQPRPRTRLCHLAGGGCPEGRAAARWDLARRLEEEREEYIDEEGAETFPASGPRLPVSPSPATGYERGQEDTPMPSCPERP